MNWVCTRRSRLGGAVAMAMLISWAVASQPAHAAVPSTISVEGVLLTKAGGPVSDGDYKVTFNLYANKGAKTPAWTTTVAALAIKAGAFQYALGTAKALPAALVDAAKTGWLGIVVGGEPELPRSAFHASPFAVRAAVAESANFPYAGSLTKGGPAKDLACTGCVGVKELKIDGDLDLGGNALKAKQVSAGAISATSISASSYIGDGSKLTGLKTPAGKCNQGQVVVGIDNSGKLICVSAAGSLPKDGLDEISNGVLSTEFTDTFQGKANVVIPDNNPIGISDAIVIPDVGTAQKLSITLHVTNSNLKNVQVALFAPVRNHPYLGLGPLGPLGPAATPALTLGAF